MKICGIISEYNPFHNGHSYHMEKARDKTCTDTMVCVMSGNFTQRGAPAVFDKWIRAEAALKSGADIVIELPLLGAVQSAEGFAEAGVKILNGIGADYIAFGSECDEPMLHKAAALFAEEPAKFKCILKRYLDQGLSFPAARAKAAGEFLKLEESQAAVLAGSNAILAIEYLKAMKKTGSSMQPVTIGRTGSAYNETHLQGQYSSATAIRSEMLKNGFSGTLLNYIPAEAFNVFQQHLSNGFKPAFLHDLDSLILYALRRNPDCTQNLYDVCEGLENRIREAANQYSDITGLLSQVKSKRYTYTRLCRILIYALLGISKDVIDAFKKSPPYARVLGIRRRAESALSYISQSSKIPVITNPSSGFNEMLYFDMLASDIYALTQKEKPYCTAKRDLTEKFIKV